MAIDLKKLEQKFNTLFEDENIVAEFEQWLEARKFCQCSSTLPDGFKVYKCTDCQTINVIKDNGEITVGLCSNCEHPLWND